MKNGLKLFGKFKGIFLEARVGGEAKEKFIRDYGVATGENITDDNAFMVRGKNGWAKAHDLKMYFDAPDWVVESLRKLGFRIVKRQIEMEKYDGGLKEYPWKVCSKELFWWLVDFGYKLGKNQAISYDFYIAGKKIEVKSAKKETEKTAKNPELIAVA